MLAGLAYMLGTPLSTICFSWWEYDPGGDDEDDDEARFKHDFMKSGSARYFSSIARFYH